MDLKTAIQLAYEKSLVHINKGEVATYIPELKNIDPTKFGVCLIDKDNNFYKLGDHSEKFSIQSISKLFNLVMAMNLLNEELWGRVGREPSGQAFNSFSLLEHENGVARNPFINAGAITVIDILLEEFGEDVTGQYLNFFKSINSESEISFNEKVYKSEYETSDLNKAIGHLIKHYGNLHCEVDEVIKTYLKFCSLELNTVELAKSGYFLMNRGHSLDNVVITNSRHAKRANSIMMTCGMYDDGGDFAYKVGLPAKSGVGGGLLAVLPGEFVVATWSPALNKKGNSLVGIKFLEELTTILGVSAF